MLQKTDTFSSKLSKDTLDAPVKYYAKDSVVVLVKDNKICLYGRTKTEYQDITLTAPASTNRPADTDTYCDKQKRQLPALSLKKQYLNRVTQGFTSDSIAYNFKTQKGLTKNTITPSGEMFVHGEVAKKVARMLLISGEGYSLPAILMNRILLFVPNKIKVINNKLGCFRANAP